MTAMDSRRAISLLVERVNELEQLKPDWRSTEQYEWRERTEATLRRVFGDDHRYVEEFRSIDFYATESNQVYWYESGRRRALSKLKAAIYELDVLAQPSDFTQDASIDPDLWGHVRDLVQREEWDKVASQVSIFLESTLRDWAGRPESEVGVELMSAVLKPREGEFPLGRTDSEREGWHLYGRGLAQALRNVDTHRIQDRPDLKRYALGVLGAASLLLTQLRYEHGNRLRSPAAAASG